MSRYFISVPVGPEALTLFNVAPLYSSLMCALFLSFPLSPSLSLPPCLLCLCLRPSPRWVGVRWRAPHLSGIDWGSSPK